MTRQWKRLHASGDEYVVVLDADNKHPILTDDLPSLLTLGGTTPASGVIRAVHTAHMPGGDRLLDEDPAAQWWCDAVSPHGQRVGTTASGVRVLIDALVAWGFVAFEDRRDAIPVGSPDGVRDVLAGRGGYAADLGRWRIADARENIFIVRIGSEYIGVCTRAGTHETCERCGGAETENTPARGAFEHAPVRLHVHAPSALVRVEKGIAHADMTFGDSLLPGRQASSLAAAATALILRHVSPLDTPHHWMVHMPGGDVAVRMFATEDGEHVSVSGPVSAVQHE